MRTPQVTHFSFACIRECALRTRSACLTFGTSTLSLTAPTHEGPALGDHRCEDTAQNVSFAVYITLCGVWWRGKCISRAAFHRKMCALDPPSTRRQHSSRPCSTSRAVWRGAAAAPAQRRTLPAPPALGRLAASHCRLVAALHSAPTRLTGASPQAQQSPPPPACPQTTAR